LLIHKTGSRFVTVKRGAGFCISVSVSYVTVSAASLPYSPCWTSLTHFKLQKMFPYIDAMCGAF